MRKFAFVAPSLLALLVIALLGPVSASAQVGASESLPKLGPLVRAASRTAGWSRVIVRAKDAAATAAVESALGAVGGQLGRRLNQINGRVAYVPNAALTALAERADVAQISLDRRVTDVSERTAATVGATDVRRQLGYDGSGVGVAIIDSGVTSWHDDLTGGGTQRVDRFVDFVNGRQSAHDDYGHGTHVAGIIAGNGFDSGGARAGIAPAAHLVVLKALDDTGVGRLSDVLAALEYAIVNKDALNIRVINLSLAAGVYESYNTDPLTLAAKRAVDAGIVVVAAAGNLGRDSNGRTQYGGVSAPANAPWVLTVGASSHMGTVKRSDDTVASFSSRGPTAVDYSAKPDILAPGVGIESLSNPASRFYTSKSSYLLPGTVATAYLPYLSLSGTSMAAPVVSGTVALMLQANPALTPNQVKAILQYTSQTYRAYDPLTQGAGFLNAQGAVALARFFAAPAAATYPASSDWSRQIIWANRRVRGGRLMPDANAWSIDVTWGVPLTPGGQNVAWGVIEREGIAVTWGSACADPICSSFAWGPGAANVVWGERCGGDDCRETWSISAVAADFDDTVVWGTTDDDTVVWGTTNDETVVWGTSEAGTVVWGTSDLDTVVWGTSDAANIIWGTELVAEDDATASATACTSCEAIP
jgi:serine protease AprX